MRARLLLATSDLNLQRRVLKTLLLIGLRLVDDLLRHKNLLDNLPSRRDVVVQQNTNGKAPTHPKHHDRHDNGHHTHALSLLAGLGTLYFLSAVTNYLLNRLMLETSTVIMRELRAELFARMQKLPISYFDANTNGSLMSYYTNDIEATNELLQHSITQMLISVTSLTGTIAMMLVLSMRLFAIMVVLGFSETWGVRFDANYFLVAFSTLLYSTPLNQLDPSATRSYANLTLAIPTTQIRDESHFNSFGASYGK